MNTKHCVYRNCGNTNAFATKLTFFGFPLKDEEKCRLWARMAGYNEPNYKSKYLCENHFSTIYVSKTPRRTVLLPNAVPYRWDENINKDESYDDEYNSDKNVSREEFHLSALDDDEVEETDMIYTDGIEMIRDNAPTADEHVETLDEAIADVELNNVNSKVHANTKSEVVKVMHEPVIIRTKNVNKITPNNRISLAANNDILNHVTKRPKLQTSTENTESPKDPLKIEENCVNTASQPEHSLQIDNTVDNPDITTFIYKGEEYIQMPKRIYLEQRTQLDADVKRYRTMIQKIADILGPEHRQ